MKLKKKYILEFPLCKENTDELFSKKFKKIRKKLLILFHLISFIKQILYNTNKYKIYYNILEP